MKIRLLIATDDKDYAEHLSAYLSEKYSETFEVAVTYQRERLEGLIKNAVFDVALLGKGFEAAEGLGDINVPIVLSDGSLNEHEEMPNIKYIRKYQRISSMVSEILVLLSGLPLQSGGVKSKTGKISVVWSPAGGTGKTSVATALSFQKATTGKNTVYLNLENFASTSAYFRTEGKSISKAFESLDTDEANLKLLIKGMWQKDSATGVHYFKEPDNYVDVNLLKPSDVEELVLAIAHEADEVIVDLSSQYNECYQKLFELASNVYIVVDSSKAAHIKLTQFITQHNSFGKIKPKTILVCNKGAKVSEPEIARVLHLPPVQSTDPAAVSKSLSANLLEV